MKRQWALVVLGLLIAVFVLSLCDLTGYLIPQPLGRTAAAILTAVASGVLIAGITGGGKGE